MTASPALSGANLGWPDDLVEVARIGEPWGIQGGFKVQPFSSDPQALLGSKRWFLLPAEAAPGVATKPAGPAATTGLRLSAPRALDIKRVREQGDTLVCTAPDIEDRNQAETLRGARVFVTRAAFPSPESDEYYWIDLIGLNVINRAGEALGVVDGLIDTGPHSVLRCLDADKVERLIPFVAAYIDSVSLQERRIVADWGLDY